MRADLKPEIKPLVASRLLAILAMALGLLTLTGCLLSMPKPLVSARRVDNVPDLVGRYLDEKGQEIRILGRDNTANNSFVAYPPSKKNPLTLTIQNLEGQRFLLQAQPEGSVGVFLTVAEINLPKITLYGFPDSFEAIVALAKKNQVTINPSGVITEYKSAQGIINLFQGLFSIDNREVMVFTKQPK
ncbi:MAG: hypothetical protein LBR11_12545 [Deltaproteobacteria bacterium]|jgi:hypothetical protein|nr:hypothetical protein [Deltaproteobacteria bacterium]